MEYLWGGILEAYEMVVSRDPLLISATVRTVWISTLAVLLATIISLPLGTLLARASFPGRQVVVLLFRTAMAVPTVFLGILCYGLFARRGPLGALDLLYSPWVIVCGEFLLAVPILVSITQGSVRALDPRVAETARTLGARSFRRAVTYLSEARVGVTLAILTAFARCVTELGIAMMVGGNIKGQTRTLATATALETAKGEFSRGLAMGIILLVIALGVTGIIGSLSRDEEG